MFVFTAVSERLLILCRASQWSPSSEQRPSPATSSNLPPPFIWPICRPQDFEKFVNEYAEKQQEAITACLHVDQLIGEAEPGICRSLSEVRCGRESITQSQGWLGICWRILAYVQAVLSTKCVWRQILVDIGRYFESRFVPTGIVFFFFLPKLDAIRHFHFKSPCSSLSP